MVESLNRHELGLWGYFIRVKFYFFIVCYGGSIGGGFGI